MQKFIAIGNVGQDPEVRLAGETKVATLSLATTERGYKLQNGTEVPDRTEWHNLVVWRGLAEVVEKFVHKGDKLYVEGKMKTRSYDDKNGVKRYVTEIVVDNLEMLGGKSNTYQTEQNKVDERAKEFKQEQFPPQVNDDGLPF